MEELKQRGRPKSDDPKIKLDNVRLKTSTIIDVEIIADMLGVTPSVFVQTLLENEMQKYKKLLNLEEN